MTDLTPKKTRPGKYNATVAAVICEGIEKGLSRELAASYAGVTRQCVFNWTKDKPEFAELVQAAEARAAAHWLDQIEKAAWDGNWQAAAWRLERRYPDTYGVPKVRHEVTGKDGGSIRLRLYDARALSAELAAGSTADSGDVADHD